MSIKSKQEKGKEQEWEQGELGAHHYFHSAQHTFAAARGSSNLLDILVVCYAKPGGGSGLVEAPQFERRKKRISEKKGRRKRRVEVCTLSEERRRTR